MGSVANSKTDSDDRQAGVWLKPDQVERLKDAVAEVSTDYQSLRNEAIIQLLYDTGLRVGELVQVNTDMVDWEEGHLRVPASIQKKPPKGSGPEGVTLGLMDETVRLLRHWTNSRDDDSEALFPSRQSDRITKQSVRNVVNKAAKAAGVRPYEQEGRGEPSDITPHTLRHSVAWRMIRREDKTIYDVKLRLRHASVTTTESVYSHFEVR